MADPEANPSPEPTDAASGPWNRREGESSPAFASLRAYLDLGPDRSLATLSRQLDKSLSLLKRWSAQGEWGARAAAWDDRRARVEQDAADRVAGERAALWERRREEESDSLFGLATALRQRVLQMVKMPLTTAETTRESADGKLIETTIIKGSRWTLATACTMAKTSADLAQMAIGAALDTEDDFDPFTATPAECKAYIDRQLVRRGRPRPPSDPAA